MSDYTPMTQEQEELLRQARNKFESLMNRDNALRFPYRNDAATIAAEMRELKGSVSASGSSIQAIAPHSFENDEEANQALIRLERHWNEELAVRKIIHLGQDRPNHHNNSSFLLDNLSVIEGYLEAAPHLSPDGLDEAISEKKGAISSAQEIINGAIWKAGINDLNSLRIANTSEGDPLPMDSIDRTLSKVKELLSKSSEDTSELRQHLNECADTAYRNRACFLFRSIQEDGARLRGTSFGKRYVKEINDYVNNGGCYTDLDGNLTQERIKEILGSVSLQGEFAPASSEQNPTGKKPSQKPIMPAVAGKLKSWGLGRLG